MQYFIYYLSYLSCYVLSLAIFDNSFPSSYTFVAFVLVRACPEPNDQREFWFRVGTKAVKWGRL